MPAADLATLTGMEIDGELTATQAKQVLAEIGRQRGRRRTGDCRLEGIRGAWTPRNSRRWSTTAIAAQPDAWAKYCGGEGKALGALVGAVMKASRGQADGKAVTALLERRRSAD